MEKELKENKKRRTYLLLVPASMCYFASAMICKSRMDEKNWMINLGLGTAVLCLAIFNAVIYKKEEEQGTAGN